MMRKRVSFTAIICLAIFLAIGGANAETLESGGAEWDSQGLEPFVSGEDVNEALNETGILNHTHDFEAPEAYEDKHHDDTFGLGADVVLLETDGFVEEVRSDYRFDARNNNHSVYLVGRVNLFQWFKDR